MASVETKVALLQALIQGDSYGLELIERVKKMTNGSVVLLQGRVYPSLRQLESEGLLESYESEPMQERSGRPRVYYKITAKGLRAARQDAKDISGLFVGPSLGRL
jgi:PadR family transcriptional regulator PadR